MSLNKFNCTFKNLIILAFAALSIWIFVACGETTEKEPNLSVLPEGFCDNFSVPGRFAFSWEKLNHRLSLWNMELLPKSDCDPAKLKAGVIGGDFSTGDVAKDNPTINYDLNLVKGAGEFAAKRLSEKIILGPEKELSGNIDLLENGIEISDKVALYPVIEGFEINTDTAQDEDYPEDYNPSHGYTSRGFGIELSMSEDKKFIDYKVRVEHGALDRKNMNRAMLKAKLSFRLDILLIAAAKEAKVFGKEISYTESYPKPDPKDKDNFVPRPKSQDMSIEIEGEASLGAGFAAIQSFSLLLESKPEEKEGKEDKRASEDQKYGYYIRVFDIGLRPKSFDSESGKAVFEFEGYASNSTMFPVFIESGMNKTFNGKMLWFQGSKSVLSTLKSFKEQFPTGEIEFDLFGDKTK